jgi:aspartokinase
MLVLKFGGTSVADADAHRRAAPSSVRARRAGGGGLALAGVTDALLRPPSSPAPTKRPHAVHGSSDRAAS